MKFSTLLLVSLPSAFALPAITRTQNSEVTVWYDRAALAQQASAVECKPYIVIFARGTTEPDGSNGGILIGDKFIKSLKAELPGQVSSEGVTYKASVGGYLSGGNSAGIQTMARMMQEAVSSCPNSKLVVGGYSQGGQVTHKAIGRLPFGTKSRIAAVVIFGDPLKNRPILGISPDKVDTVCASADPICKGIPLPFGAHLSYSRKGSTARAAKWVAAKVKGGSAQQYYGPAKSN